MMMRTDRNHGSPYDRGSADSWYGREAVPHYYEADTYASERIGKDDMTEAEIREYWRGYDDNEADLNALNDVG